MQVSPIISPASTRAIAIPAPAAGGAGGGLQEIVDDFREEVSVTGLSVALVEPNGTVAAAASGLADATRGRELLTTHRMRAASVSKTMTAAAVLDLVDRGRLSLGDTLDRWHPEFGGAREITVGMLLDHTSGIADYLNDPRSSFQSAKHTDVWTPGQPIAAADALPRQNAPGAQHAYSNSNYQLLRSIHDQVATEPLRTASRKLLERAGISTQEVEVDRGTGRPPTSASGHLRVPGDDAVETTDRYFQRRSILRSVLAGGDGQLVTTTTGLARWGAGLLGAQGRVLSADAREVLLRSVDAAPEQDGVRYGHGVFRVDLAEADGTPFAAYGHNGAIAGFRSLLLHAPHSGRTVAVQVNEQGFDENEMWILAQRLLSEGAAAQR